MHYTVDCGQAPADERERSSLSHILSRKYPFLKRVSIGHSRCGRTIEALSLGNETEQVLYCGAFHGMEWLTSLLLYRFLDEICSAAQTGGSVAEIRIGRFLNRRGLVVVPCVNPDGVEISLHGAKSAGTYANLVSAVSKGKTDRWQANAAGVDINHNFNAGWQTLHEAEQAAGITGPAATRFGGPYPESEPETQALTHFCKHRHIRHATAFHSQGEEIYWHFGDNTPEQSRLMATVLAQTSGYAMSAPEGLAVGGGFKDWFITKFGRPAFTIEIGKGKNPLPMEDLAGIYRQLEEALTLCLIL
ncbi:MAG TPA: gamma-D-glutamyl-meso-diaminopimelate peptidase [Candidatus Scatavimonas merdigallinarum]|uniref:Gamma-D-glutamyl-meso-diaminopimelate peptidase n=1 Tax=Candidatus Scatavimonas merdigallinarum TaxID=2840914 RepID=A0A9D0ZHG6_9FIRM|nr:gamma-D-glutamyl-meso-diaminopimelate peptidase [Candidatus Scatavimonas merdigallinarum]